MAMLVVAPSLAGLDVKVTTGVVKDICFKTQDPSFCLGVLNKIPQVSSVDLPGLANITINLATSNATKTLQRIKSLIPKTSERQLKEAYTSCSEHYDDAIGDLDDAKKNLTEGDSNGVNLSVSAAMDEASDCDDEINDLPADASIIKANQDLNKICDIILAISKSNY